jgi:tetratricopeptide (TPR) repeat protein
LHDDHLAAGALALLAASSSELGDNASAIAYAEASLQLAREQGDTERTRRALNTLGGVHRVAGNPELAQPLFEECLRLAREQGDSHYTAMVAGNLATTYIARGELTRAWPLALEHIEVSSASKSKMSMRTALETVTVLAAAELDWPAAARMLAAAYAERESRGLNLRDRTDIDLVPAETTMRKSLGEGAFETAYETGHALTLEQAVDEARAWFERFTPAAQSEEGLLSTQNRAAQGKPQEAKSPPESK